MVTDGLFLGRRIEVYWKGVKDIFGKRLAIKQYLFVS